MAPALIIRIDPKNSDARPSSTWSCAIGRGRSGRSTGRRAERIPTSGRSARPRPNRGRSPRVPEEDRTPRSPTTIATADADRPGRAGGARTKAPAVIIDRRREEDEQELGSRISSVCRAFSMAVMRRAGLGGVLAVWLKGIGDRGPCRRRRVRVPVRGSGRGAQRGVASRDRADGFGSGGRRDQAPSRAPGAGRRSARAAGLIPAR